MLTLRRPPGTTRTDTLFPYASLVRSLHCLDVEVSVVGQRVRQPALAERPAQAAHRVLDRSLRLEADGVADLVGVDVVGADVVGRRGDDVDRWTAGAPLLHPLLPHQRAAGDTPETGRTARRETGGTTGHFTMSP